MSDILMTDQPQVAASDMVLAKNMAELLHKHYPGHLWAVTCENGLATVRNMYLSGQWGFVLKIGQQYSISAFDKAIVRAGGELLERYRLSRGAFSDAQYHDIKTDIAGNLLADKS